MATVTTTKKKPTLSYETIVRDVRAGNIKPIYYLMGAESYYIDHIADFIVDTILKPEERDFNLLVFFGADTTIENVINAAKGYPMGAQRQVVVVKEAQNLANMDRLEFYLLHPQPSTVLILCHKNGTLDRRKKISAAIERVGVLYESAKLYESQLPAFITSYLKRRKVGIDPQAAVLLGEHVGADLNRIAGELDKLTMVLPADKRVVTTEHIERYVGISKEFNVFELQEALAQKDVAKAGRIANYFDRNSKENPIQKTLASLFNFFANLMQAYYAPERNERAIAAYLGITDWQARRNVIPAMRHYSATKVMQILHEIRRTDARSKGVDSTNSTQTSLLQDLLYFILRSA